MSQIENIAAELSLWANESEVLYSKTNDLVFRNISQHLNLLSAYTYRLLDEPSGGVSSFNTRIGDVVLLSSDVTTALTYTPVTEARTLTINGVTYDLSANRSWTISTTIPTLAQVTTAGNTTTNAITVGGFTSNASSTIVGAAAGTIGTRVLTVEGSLPEIWFKDTFAGANSFVLSKYGSAFYFARTSSTGVFQGYSGAIVTDSWSFGHGTNPAATVHIRGANVLSSTKALLVQNSSPTDLLTIWNDGAVGINTSTNAGYKLDVNGTARIVNKTNIGSETVSQGSLYIGHNGTAGGSNGTATVFFVSQFGNYPYRLGAENNGYDFYLRQVNGGQGSINIDFSGLNSISYNITNTNVLNQAFGKSAVINAKATLNSYLAIGTTYGGSNSTSSGDSPLIFFRSMDGSYYDKTLDAAVTIRNGLPTVADNNITKNTAYWYRNGYIGIGTSTTLSATNTLKGAITINQGTTIGYRNLTPGSLSSVITSGTSATVSFTPDNGNVVVGYDIIVGTIITANGISRRVTAVNYNSVTVDSAVDWSAGYNYTYRNPYVSIADGSTPIFDILPSGNVAVGTTTSVAKFTVAGSITAASLLAQGVYFNNTLVAAANNDVLVGLDINPTFTNGAFTGVQNIPLRVGTSSTAPFGSPLVFMGKDFNGETNFQISNSTSGTQSVVGFRIFAANNRSSFIAEVASAYTLVTEWAGNLVIEPNAAGVKHGLILSIPETAGGSDFMIYTAGRTSSNKKLTLFNATGNLLLQSGGTHTDAGYKLDVNGSFRYRTGGIFGGGVYSPVSIGPYIMTYVSSTTSFIHALNDTSYAPLSLRGSSISFYSGQGSYSQWILDNNGMNLIDAGSGLNVHQFARDGVARSSGTTPYAAYTISPVINNTGTYSGIVRGIYYNPTLTSLTGTTHRAIETVSGDVLLATTSGNVGIGTTTPTYKLQVVGTTYNTFSTNAPFLVDTSANNYRIANLINNPNYHSGGFANNTFDIFSVGSNSSSTANASQFFRININGGSSSGAYGSSGNNVTLAQLNAVTNSILYITAQGQGGYIQGGTSGGLTVSTLTDGENLSLRSDKGSGFGGGGINYYASINGANHSHRWFTTLTEHMRLTSGGNLLIGTTTDAGYKLDVNGTARVQTSLEIGSMAGVTFGGGATALSWVGGGQLRIGNSATWIDMRFYSGLVEKYTQTTTLTTITNTTINLATNTVQLAGINALTYSGTDIRIGSVAAYFNSLSLYVAGSEKARIDSSGNFGLGTTTPSYPLHISSAAAANIFGTVQSTNANGTAAWVAFNDQSDNVVYRVFGSGASGTQMGIALARTASLIANLGGSGKFLIGTYSGTDLVFGTSDTARMRLVDSTGNFLIGTMTDSGYKLSVAGSASVSNNLNVGGVVDTAATYTNCGLNAPVNVTTNGTVIIGFTAKLDPNGWWNPGTKKWSPTIPGYYYVALQVRWDIGTLGNQINIQILQNTNTVAIAQDLLPTNTGLTQTTNAILYMNGSTDYLEFSGFTSSTSGEFIFGEPAGNWTFFNAFRIN